MDRKRSSRADNRAPKLMEAPSDVRTPKLLGPPEDSPNVGVTIDDFMKAGPPKFNHQEMVAQDTNVIVYTANGLTKTPTFTGGVRNVDKARAARKHGLDQQSTTQATTQETAVVKQVQQQTQQEVQLVQHVAQPTQQETNVLLQEAEAKIQATNVLLQAAEAKIQAAEAKIQDLLDRTQNKVKSLDRYHVTGSKGWQTVVGFQCPTNEQPITVIAEGRLFAINIFVTARSAPSMLTVWKSGSAAVEIEFTEAPLLSKTIILMDGEAVDNGLTVKWLDTSIKRGDSVSITCDDLTGVDLDIYFEYF